jgi:hypothetical protein
MTQMDQTIRHTRRTLSILTASGSVQSEPDG